MTYYFIVNKERIMRIFNNEQEVQAYQKESGKKIVAFEGQVYDVSNYMDLHPGGSDFIEEYIGKCIDEPFDK